MGRKNSAIYVYQSYFNLPSSVKKQIDSVLFGNTPLSFSQRLERGLLKIIKTHVLMLSLFVLIYWSYLFPLDSVSNLISEGMVEDPEDIENVQVQFFLKYHREIIGYLILTPIALYILVKTYNTLALASAKQPANELKEPLLPTKAEGTKPPDQICPEQVITSETSI